MAEKGKNYYLKVDGRMVQVDHQVYSIYYKMYEKEKYLEKGQAA